MNSLRGLYIITDEKLIPRDAFASTVEAALRGGARIIQYRDKSADHIKRLQQARELKILCQHYRALLIINDDVELAGAVDADGVHIGMHDMSLQQAKTILGKKIIGVSCYNRFELAQSAAQQGADYIAFGSFFSSSTKPDAVRADVELIHRAKRELTLPVCAIGGITLQHAPALTQAGADMLAVITDVLAADNIERRCQQFSSLFE
jgi:thiamine-phosphate pyrophosphorylase